MTDVKMQTMLLQKSTKASTGKGNNIRGLHKPSKKDDSFSDIMAMQSNPTQASAKSNNAKGTKNQSEPVVAKEITTKATTTTNDKDGNNVSETPTLEDTKTLNPETNTEEVDKDIGIDVEIGLQKFLQELQKILGITDKELDQMLQELGLTPMELLDPENLQTLILKQYNAEGVTDALVNEPLANTIKEGLQALSRLQEHIDHLAGKFSDQITPETLPEEIEVQPTVDEKLRQPTIKEEVITVSSEKDIKVLVEKDTSSFKNQSEESGLESHDRKLEIPKPTDSKTNFVDYFTSRVNQVGIGAANVMDEPVNVGSIITQIVDQIKLTINQTQTSMHLLLNPEELGHVELLVAHKEGIMTAHFTVENQVAKEALESSLNLLRQSFEEQGIKVAEVEVTIGNYSESFSRDEGNGQASGQDNSNKKPGFQRLDYGEEIDGTDLAQTERTNYNGTVDYTA